LLAHCRPCDRAGVGAKAKPINNIVATEEPKNRKIPELIFSSLVEVQPTASCEKPEVT
jgi:hypothetical protein